MAGPIKVTHGDEVHQGLLDLDGKELRNARHQNLAADPGTTTEHGRFVFRTDLDRFRGLTAGGWRTIPTMDDVTAAGISAGLVDAKGDLIVGTGDNAVDRFPVGANGRVLAANSGTATGLEWIDIPTQYDDEMARDAVGAALVAGNNIDITINDGANTITIDVEALVAADIGFTTTSRLLGRATAGGGAGEEITVGGGIEFNSGGIRTSAFTGDVTKAAGGTATTIANDVVTNAKLANMAANTIKGNNTGATADPVDLTPAQVKTLLAIVPGDISGFDTQVRTSRLDQMAAPTAAVSLNNQQITNLADGTQANHAATFGQLQAIIEGREWKSNPVDAIVTSALPNTPTYNSGAGTLTANTNAAFPTVDGVAAALNNDYLVIGQASSFQNGIYTLTQLGSGAAPWVLTRRADANSAVELRGATVLVVNGTDGKGDIYTQTNQTLADLTAAAQTWAKTGEGNTTYTADGTTIELSGNTFRIAATAAGNGLTGGGGSALAVATGAGLEISGDAVRIAAAAAGNGLVGGAGSALAVGAGTGISVAADAVSVDFSIVGRKAVGNLTGGSATEVITHNLNTRDVIKVTLVNGSSPYDAIDDFPWEATTVNTVTIYAGTGYTLPAGYRWSVLA